MRSRKRPYVMLARVIADPGDGRLDLWIDAATVRTLMELGELSFDLTNGLPAIRHPADRERFAPLNRNICS